MPHCTSALSSRCKLDGWVRIKPASSERYHHLSGRVKVAAKIPCRTTGNRLSRMDALRILRILLRIMRTSCKVFHQKTVNRLKMANLSRNKSLLREGCCFVTIALDQP